MALDEQLAQCAGRKGRRVLRLWWGSNPTVVLGCGDKPDVRPGFKEIHVSMDVQSTAAPDLLNEWAKAIETRCPVSDNLISPTPIRITL